MGSRVNVFAECVDCTLTLAETAGVFLCANGDASRLSEIPPQGFFICLYVNIMNICKNYRKRFIDAAFL